MLLKKKGLPRGIFGVNKWWSVGQSTKVLPKTRSQQYWGVSICWGGRLLVLCCRLNNAWFEARVRVMQSTCRATGPDFVLLIDPGPSKKQKSSRVFRMRGSS